MLENMSYSSDPVSSAPIHVLLYLQLTHNQQAIPRAPEVKGKQTGIGSYLASVGSERGSLNCGEVPVFQTKKVASVPWANRNGSTLLRYGNQCTVPTTVKERCGLGAPNATKIWVSTLRNNAVKSLGLNLVTYTTASKITVFNQC